MNITSLMKPFTGFSTTAFLGSFRLPTPSACSSHFFSKFFKPKSPSDVSPVRTLVNLVVKPIIKSSVSLVTDEPVFLMGQDKHHRFSERLTDCNHEKFSFKTTDFYVKCALFGDITRMEFPSTIFKGAKEGDRVMVNLDGHTIDMTVEQKGPHYRGRDFEDTFSNLQEKANQKSSFAYHEDIPPNILEHNSRLLDPCRTVVYNPQQKLFLIPDAKIMEFFKRNFKIGQPCTVIQKWEKLSKLSESHTTDKCEARIYLKDPLKKQLRSSACFLLIDRNYLALTEVSEGQKPSCYSVTSDRTIDPFKVSVLDNEDGSIRIKLNFKDLD